MRFVSIDIETTGLNPTCQVLEVGAVLDDTCSPETPVEQLPQFHAYVLRDSIAGEPYALAMHSAILKRIANPAAEENKCYRFLKPSEIGPAFTKWLADNGVTGKVVAAGKNFAGFDKQFLGNLPGFDVGIFSHRSIDPAVMFWNPQKDADLPSSKVCMERASLAGEVAHTALEDAVMVVKLVRKANALIWSVKQAAGAAGAGW
jgi:oligoribonuclease